MAAKSVAVVIMGVRASRIGPTAASIVKNVIEKPLSGDNIKTSLVDLKDFNLPLYDEEVAPAMIPAYGQFKHEHSKKWSAEIAKHDAYVLVINEYNYGGNLHTLRVQLPVYVSSSLSTSFPLLPTIFYTSSHTPLTNNPSVSGATKNAVDYLLSEWKGKPATIVSYGGHGGSKASAQLSTILSEMGLRITETKPQLKFEAGQQEGMGAITKGEISDASKSAWASNADVGKIAEELQMLLGQPNEIANVGAA
ncbi:NADPH-dependent FMN reductase [Xylariaceae sp. FL1272]|nr:NADPH-dependent FMN reductase [Xylariaceae sp. FL1272]